MNLETVFNMQDTEGNRLSYKDGRLLLHTLRSTPKAIGEVTLDSKGLVIYKKQEDEKNIFRRTNAWSINRLVLERIDAAIYTTSSKKYTIAKSRALANGQLLDFGGEQKYYIPLEHWKQSYNDPKTEKRVALLGEEWYEKLKDEMNKDYFTNLGKFVAHARNTGEVFPEPDNVFRALRDCPYSKTRVVIVGQDPYPKVGQANGYAFSVIRGQKLPFSLNAIFDELEGDLGTTIIDRDPLLYRWAYQGVLLLNRVLTVEEGKPGSHADKGWELFTNEIIRRLSQFPTPLVFILWGKSAQEVEHLIDSKYHHVIKGAHPAAEYHRPGAGFFGGKYFSKANEYLKLYYNKQINW